MTLKLHHINLCSRDVLAMAAFYKTVLGLADEPTMAPLRVLDEGYPGAVALVTDGNTQMHLAERDLEVGFRTGLAVNPADRGHIAFRTDDIAAFKRHLDSLGIRYSDYGSRAVRGWQQVYFYDPDGNVIEVHQVMAEAAAAPASG